MLALVVTNFGNVVAEFAGVASSLELFGMSQVHRRAGGGGASSGLLVVHGTYDSIEKIFLAASAFYVCYIVAGRAGASRLEGGGVRDGHAARQAAGIRNYGYLYMVIGAGRHDDRAVDAVLPAGVDRRERASPRGSTARRGGT